MIIFPILAALLGSLATLGEKEVLSRLKVDYRLFTASLFLFLFLFSATTGLFIGKISSPEIFAPQYILLFLAMITVAVSWNLLLYRGLQHQSLTEFELITMSKPIFVILFASILLPAERNLQVFVAALVASLALFFSHIRQNHLTFNSYSQGLLLYLFLSSTENVLIKLLLEVYSPTALYAARTGIIFLVLLLVIRPHFTKLDKKDILAISLLSLLGTAFMIIQFTSFDQFGIVFTALYLTLLPILVYLFAVVFLKEKLKLRVILASLVILGAIIYASVFG